MTNFKPKCYLEMVLKAISADWTKIAKEVIPVNQCNSGYKENYSVELGVFEYFANNKREILVLELNYLITAHNHNQVTVHANYAYADDGDTKCYKTSISSIDVIDDIASISKLLSPVAIYSDNKNGDIRYNMADAVKFEKFLTKKMAFFLAPFTQQITLNEAQTGNVAMHHARNFK